MRKKIRETVLEYLNEDINEKKLNNLIKNLAYLVDNNEHIEARLEIAKFFNLKKYEKIFTYILKIYEILKYMDDGLWSLGIKMSNYMLDEIEKKYGKEIRNKINKRL